MTLASWDVSLYDTMPVHTKLPIISKPRPPLLTSRRVRALACDLAEVLHALCTLQTDSHLWESGHFHVKPQV